MMRAGWAKLGDLAVPAVILGCMLVTLARFPHAICPDSALHLSFGARILDGETPYVDFYEPNPPLIMYLSVAPVWLGRLLGVSPIVVFDVLVLGAVVWSTLSIRRTMRALDLPGRGLILTCWAALAWATLFSDQGSFTFGQREHLFVLGYVPFLLLRVARWADRPVPHGRAIAIGIVAGTLTALKPQFVLVAVIPELYWLATHRRRAPLLAPEVIAAVAVGVAYLLHFLAVPAYLATLRDVWASHAAFDDPWAAMVVPGRVAWIAIAAALATQLPRAPRGDPQRELTAGLVAFALASFAIVYLLSRKAWTYHYEPAFHGSVLVIASVLVRTELLARAWRHVPTMVALAAFAVSTQVSPGLAGMRLVPKLERMIEQHTAPGEHVMILACGVPPTWPLLLQLDRRSASRYPALVMPLAPLYPPDRPFAGYPSRTSLSERERRLLDTLRDDARLHAPGLVLVARGQCRGTAAGFELATYLDKVGFLDEVFGGYRELGDIEDRSPLVVFGFTALAR